MHALTVINESSLEHPTFAVWAILPVESASEVWCATWLAQMVGRSNRYTFSWELAWGFAWAAWGVREGRSWRGEGTMAADPRAVAGCVATVTYDGDFRLVPGIGTPDGTTLWVDGSPTVRVPRQGACIVSVSLAGAPVMAAAAGPNLRQVFRLQPTFHVAAGDYEQGQLVDPSFVAGLTRLEFGPGATRLTATWGPDNTWSVRPTTLPVRSSGGPDEADP